MSDRRLVYLSGEPGVGKSTLMRRITDGWERHPQPEDRTAPARDLLLAPGRGIVAVELGRHRDSFSGTDALGSAVIGTACRYLALPPALDEAPLLLAEGARLANRRFLTHAVTCGWQVTLVHLYGARLAAARRRHRAEQLGKREQAEAWVKGRQTAARNLANTADAWGVEVRTLNVEAVEHPLEAGDLVRELRGWAPCLR